MAGKGNFGEALYFSAHESERRDAVRKKLDEKARRLALREAISEALETGDSSLVEQIQALGFDGDSARVFDLLPLIHVSWADGKIQRNERALILGLLDKRGIERGSTAFVLIESLLEKRPSPEFTQVSLDLLRSLLSERGRGGASIVDLCLEVADASGGLLGLGNRVSGEERDTIEYIAEMLGPEAHAELVRLLG